jgi:nanoRNase/pAp phosphatase (c-di-AMP/oligoRNAs hydrolase)
MERTPRQSQKEEKKKKKKKRKRHTAVIQHALFLNGRPGAHAWLAVATTTTTSIRTEYIQR